MRCLLTNMPVTDMSRARNLMSCVLAGVLGLAVLAVPPAQAQSNATADASQPEMEKSGNGFFGIGVNGVNLAPLNDRLGGAGYPTFPTELLAVGGGGYGVVADRLMVGGTGYGLIAPSRADQGREVSVRGGYGLFTMGYRFQPDDQLVVYPQVGVGGGGLSLDIGSTGADDFDDVLNQPNREASLQKGSVLVSLGAGAEYRLGTPEEPGGVRLGLRAGYILAPYSSDWALGEDRLSGGPDATFSGPYVRLTISGWGDE